jgi:hypothetical protein
MLRGSSMTSAASMRRRRRNGPLPRFARRRATASSASDWRRFVERRDLDAAAPGVRTDPGALCRRTVEREARRDRCEGIGNERRARRRGSQR